MLKNFLNILIFLLLLSTTTFSKDITVDPDGEIRTLTEALQIAENGDRIIVQPGQYREGNIIVDRPVEIIGIDYPEFDGENKYEVIRIKADSVTIRGLKITNVGVSYIDDRAGIRVDKSHYCTIKDNIFKNTFFGIYLSQSSNCQVDGNELFAYGTREVNTGNGIHLWYSRDITIENNIVNGHRDGIYLEFVRNTYIQNNLGENNLRYGLHFMFSDSCYYHKNTFRRNGAGVAVMYTRHVVMTDNTFEYNWGTAAYGLLLKDISRSRIENNIFYKNTVGIFSEGSNWIDISENDFIENGWAVRIWSSSYDNTFTQNNFINNTFDVATNSKRNFNEFVQNYWSNYDGYDLAGDGYGDVPYRPVRLFSYITEKHPPAMILLHSFFINVLDFAERIVPTITPETLVDEQPVMRRIRWNE